MLPEIEHKPSGDDPPATGLLDELRAVYTLIDDDEAQTMVFDVEGSRAAVRYRRMRNDDRLAIARRIYQDDKDAGQFEVNAQFLIEACDEILARNDDGELEPVLPGKVVTFAIDPARGTVALHQALGVEERDVRRSVLRLFQGVDDAMLRHAEQVSNWMGTVQSRAGEKFSGG